MVAGTYEISLLVLILFSPQWEISYLRVAVETFSEDQILSDKWSARYTPGLFASRYISHYSPTIRG